MTSRVSLHDRNVQRSEHTLEVWTACEEVQHGYIEIPGTPEHQVVIIKAAASVPLDQPVPQATGPLRPGLIRAQAAAALAAHKAGPLSCHVCKRHQTRLQ